MATLTSFMMKIFLLANFSSLSRATGFQTKMLHSLTAEILLGQAPVWLSSADSGTDGSRWKSGSSSLWARESFSERTPERASYHWVDYDGCLIQLHESP